MKLWDFKYMRNGKISIGNKIAEPLGLLDESEVFTTMFKYESDDEASFEAVVSPFGPENYREISYITFQIRDEPGALAQCAKFLKDRNIDILNSESIAFLPSIVMTWVMLIDLSFYGDRENLEREFREAKESLDASISLIDSILIEPSNLADRYTKGSTMDNDRVTTRALKKLEKKISLVRDGTLELPDTYLNFFGQKDAPVMLIGDTESWVLSVSFLPEKTKLWRLKFTIPDKPGAVFDISNLMAKENINIMAGYTQVLVYYKKMLYEIVVDISGARFDRKEINEVIGERISSLGKEFAILDSREIFFT